MHFLMLHARFKKADLHQIHTTTSRISPHVLRSRPHGFIRRGEVALMERAHLVRLNRANDSVQHTSIVEQDEVLFLPVVRIHQLVSRWVNLRESVNV